MLEEKHLRLIEHYASMVLEWLDLDATEHNLPRAELVEQFVDTLQAMEQYKEQED